MSTVRFTAGYVPGISHEELAWHTLEYRENDSRLEVKVPILTQAQMLTVTQSVKNACNAQIKTMDVSEIVRAIDQAILRLLDVNNEDRKHTNIWI